MKLSRLITVTDFITNYNYGDCQGQSQSQIPLVAITMETVEVGYSYLRYFLL